MGLVGIQATEVSSRNLPLKNRKNLKQRAQRRHVQFLSVLCASVFFFLVLPPNASTLVSEYLDKRRDIQEVDNSVLINIRFGLNYSRGQAHDKW